MEYKNKSQQVTKLISGLTAEQAYATGTAAGSMLQNGMAVEDIPDMTVKIAEFIKKGMSAQQAVDEIIAAIAQPDRTI